METVDAFEMFDLLCDRLREYEEDWLTALSENKLREQKRVPYATKEDFDRLRKIVEELGESSHRRMEIMDRLGMGNEYEKEDLKKLLAFSEIADNMRGQDNQATAHPVFCVRTMVKQYNEDGKFKEWIDDDGCEVDEGENGAIEATFDKYWHTHQMFFSRKGAERYIEANKHNLNDPHIYVDTAYRNSEWIAVRELLLSIDEGVSDMLRNMLKEKEEG